MERFGLPQDRTTAFLEYLTRQAVLYGPVRTKGRLPRFDRVDDPSQIVWDYTTTVLPPKRFFQPPREVLYEFGRSDFRIQPETPADEELKVLFGLHNYDAEAISCLDYQLARGIPDEGWAARRKGWVFVGISYVPDDYHFAPSVGIGPDHRGNLDLFLEAAQGGYNVEVLTETGARLLEGWERSEPTLPPQPRPRYTNRIVAHPQDLYRILEQNFENPLWERVARRCFSCASCTLVCPTCYCFDIADELDLDLASGRKVRTWDSCQHRDFTWLAGGEVFRDAREARVRHRIYRKFSYITRHYGRPFCVGCGRCLRSCPAKISISEIANELARQGRGGVA